MFSNRNLSLLHYVSGLGTFIWGREEKWPLIEAFRLSISEGRKHADKEDDRQKLPPWLCATA